MFSKYFKLILSIIIFHMIIGSFFLYKVNKGAYEEKYITASGEVTNYLSEDYKCGKHNRYTCTKYLIYLNHIPYKVEKETFDTVVLGIDIDLYKRKNKLPYYVIYFGCSVFLGFVFLLFAPMLISPFRITDD